MGFLEKMIDRHGLKDLLIVESQGNDDENKEKEKNEDEEKKIMDDDDDNDVEMKESEKNKNKSSDENRRDSSDSSTSPQHPIKPLQIKTTLPDLATAMMEIIEIIQDYIFS